jgi:hypothetical protein
LIAYLAVVTAVMRSRLLDDRYDLFSRLLPTVVYALALAVGLFLGSSRRVGDP